MNRPRILPLAVLLGIAIFTVSARAQNTKNDEATAVLREKAYALLESVATQIGALQSGENRARVGANIVDSLWTRNEKLARSLLLQVEADLRSELEKWRPGSPTDFTHLVLLKLRADTVERLAKHDAEAALAFLKATEIKSDEMKNYAGEEMAGIEMQLAQKVAADHPETAMKLARENLEKGFHEELLSLLRQLNKKHKEPARTLYKEIVKKLQTADLLNDWKARSFAVRLAQSFRPPAVDTATHRELISTLVAQALKNGCGDELSGEDERSSFCFWLANEVPDLEKFDSRAARLRHWKSESADASSERTAALLELGALMEEGAPEEFAAAAAKNPEFADLASWHLIDRARRTGDFELARKLTNTHIKEPELRKSLLDQLDVFEKMVTQPQRSLEEMEEELSKAPPEYRVMFLIGEASKLGPSDQKLALKLLDRANDLIDAMKPSKEQTTAQITLAMTYCYEKHERCLGLMESLVPRFNALVDLAAKLDGYDTSYLRDGEWNMSANGPVGELLTRLSHNAAPFAWYDFDRAVSLAGRFDRQEIRMMAHVKLAQGILAGPPRRQPVVYLGF